MIGVIGGSGFYTFFGQEAASVELTTPYGDPSGPVTVGSVGVHGIAFLPRHGLRHEFSPHTVPYRAKIVDGGTMVVVQGPRFSTRAESQWFIRQGFTLVNMTGYPESVLARELEMCYATMALVTDLDAELPFDLP